MKSVHKAKRPTLDLVDTFHRLNLQPPVLRGSEPGRIVLKDLCKWTRGKGAIREGKLVVWTHTIAEIVRHTRPVGPVDFTPRSLVYHIACEASIMGTNPQAILRPQRKACSHRRPSSMTCGRYTVNDSNPRLRHAYRWENRVNGGDFLMMLLKCVQITIHHSVLRAHLHGIKKLQTVFRYRKYKQRTAALFNFA